MELNKSKVSKINSKEVNLKYVLVGFKTSSLPGSERALLIYNQLILIIHESKINLQQKCFTQQQNI